MDKNDWTNFDLLNAVKTIRAQKGLPYTKAHFSVAEELLISYKGTFNSFFIIRRR